MAKLSIFALALLLTACGGTGTAAGRGPGGPEDATAARSTADAATAEVGGSEPGAEAPRGDPYVITWEALAVERDQAENPRFGRRPQQGALAAQKVVLVNESHPEAVRMRTGRTATTKGTETIAVVSDADMRLLLQGFQQSGFYRHARDTDSLQPVFDKPDARGRITVEGNGRNVSIVSMRGQGLQEGTKEIPSIYSQLKQAVSAMRNSTPTLNVRAAGAVGTARSR